MKLKNMQIGSGRRCSAKELEKILEKLPIEVEFTGQLGVHMGLGRIIYMQPEDGRRVKRVKIGGVSIERQDYLFFDHEGQKYEVKYK